MELLEKGVDPQEEREAAAQKKDSEEQKVSFRKCALDWVKERAQNNFWKDNVKGEANTLSRLTNHILPRIGDMAIEDIQTEDIRNLLMPIWSRSPSTSSKVLADVRSIFRWAIALRIRQDRENPADLSGALGVLLEPYSKSRKQEEKGGIQMEYLDIRTKDGKITGEVKERDKVHEDGDIHGTSHVWIARKNKEGQRELLLQKRSADKDAYPGCYDISSAGHLPAGQEYLPSALRELYEELGIEAKEEELIFLGIHEGYCEEVFYGRPFRNHEISHVYLYDQPVDIDKLRLQESEVESVKWMSLEKCFEEMRRKNPNYCLFPEELDMIKRYYDNGRNEQK